MAGGLSFRGFVGEFEDAGAVELGDGDGEVGIALSVNGKTVKNEERKY